jgi:putative phosphoesterase
MRIGLLSDAHGNHLWLAACLRKLNEFQVSSIYFLGDATGYLPGEAEVLRLLRSEAVYCQKGNHEAMLLGELPLPENKDATYGLAAARERLSIEDREYIGGWPTYRIVKLAGKNLLFVHGSPNNHLQEYVYPDSDLSMFDTVGYDAVVMGHTHRPFVAKRANTLVVNVGSCGLPRDQGDLPAFAVLDVTELSCHIYRLQFDADRVIRYFGADQLPRAVHDCLLRKPEKLPFGEQVEYAGA